MPESSGITDVSGVRVGHSTIDSNEIQTGVTVIIPTPGNIFVQKIPAACHVINGFGKTAGLVQIEELGELESPIALTNTLSVGAVQSALVRHTIRVCEKEGVRVRSFNPVVGECNDSSLNAIERLAVGDEHFEEAMRSAASEFARGSVGAGRGMVCHGVKGGIGSASRRFTIDGEEFVLGVLVLANHGNWEQIRLRPSDLPENRALAHTPDSGPQKPEQGSIIIVVATDLPCDARQLKRIAKRVGGGMARVGSEFGHGSGDIAIAFTTAFAGETDDARSGAWLHRTIVRDDKLDPAFSAVVHATEAAIWDALDSAAPVGDRLTLAQKLAEINSRK